VEEAEGRLPEAVALHRKALDCQREALRKTQGNVRYRQSVDLLYGLLANNLSRLGRHAEAARMVEERVRSSPPDAQVYFRAGLVLARCATLAENDAALPPEERKALAGKYADQALRQLRAAAERPRRDALALPQALRQDPAFAPLRPLPAFQQLLAELERGGEQKGKEF
jgi:tetratricopeptide (TPR) repeat protein